MKSPGNALTPRSSPSVNPQTGGVLGHGYATRQAQQPAQNDVLVIPTLPGRDRAATGTTAVRSRFRIVHAALLSEGLALGILGGFALAWSMANMHFGTEGIPILCLLVTPAHGGLLLVAGALAVVACLGQWTTAGYSGLAVAGWATLAVVSAVEAARHAPGALGFDHRDTVLYVVLAMYNLTLCVLVRPAIRTKWRNRSTR
jgi:hypothetical protein